MAERTCTMPECRKPYRAKGLCSTHYNKATAKVVTTPCVACGTPVDKTNQRSASRYRAICSTDCRSYLQHGPRACAVPNTHPSRSTPVPADHSSRVPLVCVVPETHPSRRSRRPAFVSGRCVECGSSYVIASERVTHSRYCSDTCQGRTARRARRAREHKASGTFTWDAFAKLAMSLGNACSYCEQSKGELPLEPDHVVPLSRGGHNGLTNLLPSCRSCNGDKRDLLIAEWAVDRARRGLPARRYDVDRFTHLVAHSHETPPACNPLAA